jgi:hypothetical protein
LAALPPCTTSLKDRELSHEDQRPAGADYILPSGSSNWLAALPPCTTSPKDRELFHEDKRPTGADYILPSGSSNWLAALPPAAPRIVLENYKRLVYSWAFDSFSPAGQMTEKDSFEES